MSCFLFTVGLWNVIYGQGQGLQERASGGGFIHREGGWVQPSDCMNLECFMQHCPRKIMEEPLGFPLGKMEIQAITPK